MQAELRRVVYTLTHLQARTACAERCACAIAVREAAQELERTADDTLPEQLQQLQRALEQLSILGSASVHAPDVCTALVALAARCSREALEHIASCIGSIGGEAAMPHRLLAACRLAAVAPADALDLVAHCVPSDRHLPDGCAAGAAYLLFRLELHKHLSYSQMLSLALVAPEAALDACSRSIRVEADAMQNAPDKPHDVQIDACARLCSACSTMLECVNLQSTEVSVSLDHRTHDGSISAYLAPFHLPHFHLSERLVDACQSSLLASRTQLQATATELAVKAGFVHSLQRIIDDTAFSFSAKSAALSAAAYGVHKRLRRRSSFGFLEAELISMLNICSKCSTLTNASARKRAAELLSNFGNYLATTQSFTGFELYLQARQLAVDMLWASQSEEARAWEAALASLGNYRGQKPAVEAIADKQSSKLRLERWKQLHCHEDDHSCTTSDAVCDILSAAVDDDPSDDDATNMLSARASLAADCNDGSFPVPQMSRVPLEATWFCAEQFLNFKLRTRLGGPKTTLESMLNAVRKLSDTEQMNEPVPQSLNNSTLTLLCILQLPFALEVASGEFLESCNSGIRPFINTNASAWHAWLERIREPLAQAHLALGLPAAALYHAERGLEEFVDPSYNTKSNLAYIFLHSAAELREPRTIQGAQDVLLTGTHLSELELEALEMEAQGRYEEALGKLRLLPNCSWKSAALARCCAATGKFAELEMNTDHRSQLTHLLGPERIKSLSHFDSPEYASSVPSALNAERDRGSCIGLVAALRSETDKPAEERNKFDLKECLRHRALHCEGWCRSQSDLHLSLLLAEHDVSSSYVDSSQDVHLPEEMSYLHLPELLRKVRHCIQELGYVPETFVAAAASAAMDGNNTALARHLLNGKAMDRAPFSKHLLISEEDGADEGLKSLARISGTNPTAAYVLAETLKDHATSYSVRSSELRYERDLIDALRDFEGDLAEATSVRGRLLEHVCSEFSHNSTRGRRARWQHANWCWHAAGLQESIKMRRVEIQSWRIASHAAHRFAECAWYGIKPQASAMRLVGLMDLVGTYSNDEDDCAEQLLSTLSTLCIPLKGYMELWNGIESQLFGLASHENTTVRNLAALLLRTMMSNFSTGVSYTVAAQDCEGSLACSLQEVARQTHGQRYAELQIFHAHVCALAVLPEERISAEVSSIKRALERGECSDNILSALTSLRKKELENTSDAARMHSLRRRLARKFDIAEACFDGRGGDGQKAIESLLTAVRKLLEDHELDLHDICPRVARLQTTQVPLPGKHMSEPVIYSVSGPLEVLHSKTRPKRIGLGCSDGKTRTYLLKGRESLALDEAVAQLTAAARRELVRNVKHPYEHGWLATEPYAVQPLGQRAGLVEWVHGAKTLDSIFRRWQISRLHSFTSAHSEEEAADLSQDGITGSNEYEVASERPANLFHKKMAMELRKHNMRFSKTSRSEWPHDALEAVFEQLSDSIPKNIVRNAFAQSARSAGEAHELSMRFTSKVAATSAFCYSMGLGDRHPGNVLLHTQSGSIVHVDLGVCFGGGERLRVPEVVPFRLTKTLIGALGLSGVWGPFSDKLKHALAALREGSPELMLLIRCGLFWRPPPDWEIPEATWFSERAEASTKSLIDKCNAAMSTSVSVMENHINIEAVDEEKRLDAQAASAKDLVAAKQKAAQNAENAWQNCKAEASCILTAAQFAARESMAPDDHAAIVHHWLDNCGAKAAQAAVDEDLEHLSLSAADKANQTLRRWDKLRYEMRRVQQEIDVLMENLQQLRHYVSDVVQEATVFLSGLSPKDACALTAKASMVEPDVDFPELSFSTENMKSLLNTLQQCQRLGALFGFLLSAHQDSQRAYEAAELVEAASTFALRLYTCALIVSTDLEVHDEAEFNTKERSQSECLVRLQQLEEDLQRDLADDSVTLASLWDRASKESTELRKEGSTAIEALDKTLEGAVRAASRLEEAGVENVSHDLLQAYIACLKDVSRTPGNMLMIAAKQALRRALHDATEKINLQESRGQGDIEKLTVAASFVVKPQVYEAQKKAMQESLSFLEEREANELPEVSKATLQLGTKGEEYGTVTWQQLVTSIHANANTSPVCYKIAAAEQECQTGPPALRESTWARYLTAAISSREELKDAKFQYDQVLRAKEETSRRVNDARTNLTQARATLKELFDALHRGSKEVSDVRRLVLRARQEGAWQFAADLRSKIDACRLATEKTHARCSEILDSKTGSANIQEFTTLYEYANALHGRCNELLNMKQTRVSHYAEQRGSDGRKEHFVLPTISQHELDPSSDSGIGDQPFGNAHMLSDRGIQQRTNVALAPSPYAVEACSEVEERLHGTEGGRNEDVNEQAVRLIKDATSPSKLCTMYEGWSAWI